MDIGITVWPLDTIGVRGLPEDAVIEGGKAALDLVTACDSPAVEAHHLMRRPVELEDARWRGAGSDVKTVDVLGHEARDGAVLEEACDGSVGHVWPGILRYVPPPLE